ncbi:amidohydrolase family protein [Brevundimonas goettingensis]|uniref:Amidohydrolase family protein n=1 Tax=Brevundimonas goettingensis TaxID=2774190 RepID=A0A975C225_9CAUL|nr:amidohydrolase family protein [Brevundimonas goettingensis]QTC90127.1 amidohydrolase family protein [Brevundimonas goettingensis]
MPVHRTACHALFLAATVAACLTAMTRAEAQERAPGPVTMVRAGNLFDSEAGRMVGPRDLLIQNGRVRQVEADLVAPEGATVLDLRRCSVLPGLIDAHTHLLLEQRARESLSETAARDQGVDGDAARVLHAAPRARSYLESGITTVRDLGNSGQYLDLILQRAIDQGDIPGPRLYGSGPGLAPEGGQLEPQPADPHRLIAGEYRIIKGPDDARSAVRQAVAAGARVIKMYPEATPQRTRLSVAEMAAVVSEAKRHGVPVAAHATSDASIREAVEAGVASIEHAYEISDETLRLMAARGVWLVPTDPSDEMAIAFTRDWPVQPPEAEVRAHLAPARDRLRRARAAGVRIAMGSDFYVPWPTGRGEAARGTLDGYVEAGMTSTEALRSATWGAAMLIGDAGLGVLRPGAYADLIAMPGDPAAGLSALHDLRLVMKGGTVARSDGGACAGT